ncbi:NAD-dependent epimerase/dehydratase family protein [Paenibacillus sp. FSL H7-0716]|uniref:NAD-dependent epimerase/dehydratase domain-containing protein n=1 Tax=Paenibacillus odorifer TaxID=189426 RepID=A0AB36JDN4_9BACL|nr:NAD-dependent epimerase/dehydratase family protein [Paenibacillus odorifer]OME19110.1 hypothetical protein BSK47_16160 [Paenibacillus odorifer]
MKNVILLGGSGYIGTHLSEEWLRKDPKVQIISVSRNGKPGKLLSSLVNHNRIKWMSVDIFDIDSYISKLPQQADAIVDMVGTATANSKEDFEKLNAEPVKIMVELMSRLNIPKGCYISGRMGMPFKNKPFLESKHRGENIALTSGKNIGIVKPSLVYGDRPDAVVMVPFVQAVGLFNKDLKPIKVNQLAQQIIQICI